MAGLPYTPPITRSMALLDFVVEAVENDEMRRVELSLYGQHLYSCASRRWDGSARRHKPDCDCGLEIAKRRVGPLGTRG